MTKNRMMKIPELKIKLGEVIVRLDVQEVKHGKWQYDKAQIVPILSLLRCKNG
nr:MAG TPA: hypothetical protein [Caudoviricetes sp.]